MDVHTSNYTFCCYTIKNDEAFAFTTAEPNYKSVLKYLEQIRRQCGETRFICGYEAGSLGYSLQRELAAHGVECIILAPSTIPKAPGQRIKTDKRDAENIARCLAYHQYKAVYIPDEEDDAVKEYIRMRNDANIKLKSTKQQIIAFCTRHGFIYDGKSYWTQRHLKWLETLNFSNLLYKEVLDEQLTLYFALTEKIAIYDRRIEELSQGERYKEKVSYMVCLLGIGTNTAMSLISETGDFYRFASAQKYSAYLGLVPGEYSSGNNINHTSITKSGNSHLRRLLIEAAQSYSRGHIGKKSKLLMAKQKGAPREIVNYADRANERLKRKFYKIAFRSKHNIAKTAVARELACFIWGMMTGHTDRNIS